MKTIDKPRAMVRALDRAAKRAWILGYVDRKMHINALSTQNRKMVEDHAEAISSLEEAVAMADLKFQLDLAAALGWMRGAP